MHAKKYGEDPWRGTKKDLYIDETFVKFQCVAIQCWECQHILSKKKKCQHTSMPLQVTSSRLICNQDQSQLFHFVRKGNILGDLKALSVPMTSRRERFSASPMPWSIGPLPLRLWNCGHTYSESPISSTNRIIANCSCHTHVYSSHNS